MINGIETKWRECNKKIVWRKRNLHRDGIAGAHRREKEREAGTEEKKERIKDGEGGKKVRKVARNREKKREKKDREKENEI